MSYYLLLAARSLGAHAIGSIVLHESAVNPLAEKRIAGAAREAGRVVTVEEHQVAGGFGSAVAELLAKKYPVPIEFVGIQDEFGQSGNPDQLLEHYGLHPAHIAEVAARIIR